MTAESIKQAKKSEIAFKNVENTAGPLSERVRLYQDWQTALESVQTEISTLMATGKPVRIGCSPIDQFSRLHVIKSSLIGSFGGVSGKGHIKYDPNSGISPDRCHHEVALRDVIYIRVEHDEPKIAANFF